MRKYNVVIYKGDARESVFVRAHYQYEAVREARKKLNYPSLIKCDAFKIVTIGHKPFSL